ncbi:hypothetical protein ACLK1Y_12130 [Escherichia coli]
MLAGLPLGMPGMGLEIEGAVQQAPQSGRHSIRGFSRSVDKVVGAHITTF